MEKRFLWRPTGVRSGCCRLLLAGCLLLPLALFVLASWLNYRAAMADAYRSMERTADVAREQAAKVFDGQSQVADRVSDLLRGMAVADVRACGEALHDAFAAIVHPPAAGAGRAARRGPTANRWSRPGPTRCPGTSA